MCRQGIGYKHCWSHRSRCRLGIVRNCWCLRPCLGSKAKCICFVNHSNSQVPRSKYIHYIPLVISSGWGSCLMLCFFKGGGSFGTNSLTWRHAWKVSFSCCTGIAAQSTWVTPQQRHAKWLIPRTSNLASQQADAQCLRFWVEARTVRMQSSITTMDPDGSQHHNASLIPSAERPVMWLLMSKNHFLVLRNHHWRLTPLDVFCPAPRSGEKHPSYIGSVVPSPTFCSTTKPLPKEKKHSPSPLEHAFFGSWISLKNYWPLRVYLWSWN